MLGIKGSFRRLIVAATFAVAGVGAAAAYNVPGSSEAMMAPLTRMAAADTAAVIASCGGETRGLETQATVGKGGGAASVSGGDGKSEIGINVRSSSAEFGSGISSSDYDLVTGSACGGQTFKLAQGNLLVGFALTYESGEGSSLYNRGTLEHDGFGGALIVSWRPGPTTRLYVSGGYSDLSFHMTRASGDIRGSFDAGRWFAAAGVNTRADWGKWFFVGDASMQYANFKADSYVETGTGFGISAPGVVPEYEIDLFLAMAEGRLGYRAGTVETYVLGGFSHDFEDGSPLSGALGTLDLAESGRTIGYFGAGFGVPIGGAGAFGLDVVQAFGGGDFENLQVRGRLSFTF